MLRDDGPLLTACAFLRGFEVLAAGTASGELKLHDAYKCVRACVCGALRGCEATCGTRGGDHVLGACVND